MNQDSRFYSIFELIAHDVHHPSDPDLARKRVIILLTYGPWLTLGQHWLRVGKAL